MDTFEPCETINVMPARLDYMQGHVMVTDTLDGKVAGFFREIHATYWPDGRPRFACYDSKKRFLGLASTREKAREKIGRFYLHLQTWPAVPFGGTSEKVTL